MNQHTDAAAQTAHTVIAVAIIASLVPVIVDATDGVTAGFYPRGDADCSVHLSAADVTSTVNGLAGHSRCGNDDCDRDGQVAAADVSCAARCLFGACPVPPHAPRVIAVAPDTAPGIVPSSVVRVTVTNLGPADRLKRVTIGAAEADVVGMVAADTLLAVVPDIPPGPADVVAIDGDLAGPPLRITVTAPVPIGTLDSFDGTLDLLDTVVAQFSTLDLEGAYGTNAAVVRDALQRFRADLSTQRAALAGDPRYSAAIHAGLDAAIEGSGISERLRSLLGEIGGTGGAATVLPPNPALTRVVATGLSQATRVMATVVLRAGSAAGAPALAKIALVAGVVATVAVVATDSPVITHVRPDLPKAGELVEIEGAGFGSLPPLPSLVIRTAGGETSVAAESADGNLLHFRIPDNVGVCGRVDFFLSRLLKRSDVWPARVQPVLRSLSVASAPPGEFIGLGVSGVAGCVSKARFKGPRADFTLPEAAGLHLLRALVSPHLPPGAYNVHVDVSDIPSEEQLPLEVPNIVTDVSIECLPPRLRVPPATPSWALCRPFLADGYSPAGLDFDEWSSSDPNTAVIQGFSGLQFVQQVDATGPGMTVIRVAAFFDDAAGERHLLARSQTGFVMQVTDETPPDIEAFELTSPAPVVPGTTIEIRVKAQDNVAVNRIQLQATGDAVLNPDQTLPCTLFENPCSRPFQVDLRSTGITQSEIRFVVQAFDTSGNGRVSGILIVPIELVPTAGATPTQTPTRTPNPTATMTGAGATRARAYVVNSGSDSVSVFDVETRTQVTTIPVGDFPQDVAVARGLIGYVTNLTPNTISVFETAGNTITGTIPLGEFPDGFHPGRVAFTPDGAAAYVTGNRGRPRPDGSQDEFVAVINVASEEMRSTVRLQQPGVQFARGEGLAFTPNGRFVYVAILTSDLVAVVDTAANTLIKTIPVGDQPTSVAITPDGQSAYVWNRFSHNVTVIDVATNTVRTTIPIDDLTEYEGGDIAIAPDGSVAYVIGPHLNDIFVIDTQTDGSSKFRAKSGLQRLAFTADGAFAWITSNGRPGLVNFYDTARQRLSDNRRVGDDPLGIALAEVPAR